LDEPPRSTAHLNRFADGSNGHQQQQQHIVSKSPYNQAAYAGGTVMA
jgi:hypothetical protein